MRGSADCTPTAYRPTVVCVAFEPHAPTATNSRFVPRTQGVGARGGRARRRPPSVVAGCRQRSRSGRDRAPAPGLRRAGARSSYHAHTRGCQKCGEHPRQSWAGAGAAAACGPPGRASLRHRGRRRRHAVLVFCRTGAWWRASNRRRHRGGGRCVPARAPRPNRPFCCTRIKWPTRRKVSPNQYMYEHVHVRHGPSPVLPPRGGPHRRATPAVTASHTRVRPAALKPLARPTSASTSCPSRPSVLR